MPQSKDVVAINEVVLRDGFQNEPTFVATEEKIRLANGLSLTGVRRIEVSSFTSPMAIPNLRDAEDVFRGIDRVPGVIYTALVPNERGVQRAIESKVDEVNLVMSIGEKHNLTNLRMTCAQSLEQFKGIMGALAGTEISVNGTIATAFGCPFEGQQPVERVLWAIDAYLELGITGITVADTIGVANPRQVGGLMALIRKHHEDLPLTLHLHNTRDMGLANALAAVDEGVRSFDSALGGIGGCPYAPGATGNVCTEDLVHMLHGCGIETGVDLEALIDLSGTLSESIGHQVPGYVLKSGTSSRLYA
ncbi:MAG: hydroxymethylglutaryl-CoA lyase [Desulfomicrobium sp.]|uniref:hydroxymethylglutaryl-CoA lyase n=1 Tax=Hoeflea sp. TaxID=1940281 RepID=UPI0025C688C0|nr:hydroxymethylglutaryl-CoA lyase [Hoeflea sp.]MBU4529328.1 hydroxymethylglutaryl-CoA lyase [Alphaproteobacteria bacterium]MBV1712642.1 hydroxymethylglutaryl-CoA lyase [Desulfomicrobium sp.]MBU4544999.1 hydroxymethylglutaryl-CoA lyase [Alphaproteobacteria bacterium]MBU4552406.1 hydroxymethylglutaryl-CoA lyase [Alphaproteobacteria bacterium]MBV1783557.1 hydroxymethylglutaryl-CoA lyase [Hoeflea sp.]